MTENLLVEDGRYLLNVYRRLPLCVDTTDGSHLVDTTGKRYLDMVGGIAVNGLGYGNAAIREAITTQLDRYIHLSNFFASPAVVELARMLTEVTFASKVFFTNSGTEAVEAALKLVRKYGQGVSPDKIEVISLHDSFHGRTFGGLSLTGQPKYAVPFGPGVPGIRHIKINDVTDLKENVSASTCAVFLEMIQGESGVRPLSREFITAVREAANRYDFCIVADEIQTGLGRTGDLFAHQYYDFTPDIMTIGKSLGGGLPLGAMLVSPRLESVLGPGDHGSTFGGNPVACAAGAVVLRTVSRQDFLLDIKAKGKALVTALRSIRTEYPHVIGEIRGRGLMLGIEVGRYAKELQAQALQQGVLMNVTNGTVIRLLPPLTISHSELHEFVSVFRQVIAAVARGDGNA